MSDTPPGGEPGAGRLVRWGPTLVAAAALVVVGARTGTVGVVVAIGGVAALLAARARLSTPAAFAVGQVALVVALGGRSPTLATGVAEAALLAVLLAPDLLTDRGRTTAGLTLVGTAALVAVAWGAQVTWGRAWATALVLAATGTLLAYGLHRVEQVQLGVVGHE